MTTRLRHSALLCFMMSCFAAVVQAQTGITSVIVELKPDPAAVYVPQARRSGQPPTDNPIPTYRDPDHAKLVSTAATHPLVFETNRGQTNSRVRFLSRGAGWMLFLTNSEIVLSGTPPSGSAAAIRMTWQTGK